MMSGTSYHVNAIPKLLIANGEKKCFDTSCVGNVLYHAPTHVF